ncbi:YgjV family protein [Gilvimarinus xylanilyticus]|uniref:YgjV family protein n=1 Tax=Gilvimarinus xylanilyticus TaxID=2944139 RepID=A0A9X2HY83_9GAMM|nr:YgjV family protein [Gilvimarinus xylanilyticus]MCP8899289.1 YgjV family protein [Gilvimarinus xylanilyticus]
MTFPELNIAQAVGFVSFLLGIACFYQRDDRHLKRVMVAMNLNHALHFALLGATTAVLSALLSLVRTSLALHTSSRVVAYAFIGITLGWGLYLADAWYDLFPIIGSCIGTYTVFCLRGIAMRFGFLLGACCWLTNNIIVGSIGLTLLEMTLIAVNLNTIRRLYRERALAQKLEHGCSD